MSGRPEFTPTGKGPIGQVGASPTGKVEGKAKSTSGRLIEHVDELKAKLDAAHRDSARLNWLEGHLASIGIDMIGWYVQPIFPPGEGVHRDGIREAIDAAMAGEETIAGEETMGDPNRPWPDSHKGHWWSGWPGASCMKCGQEHALEYALADGWYDPFEESWDTEEHRMAVEEADGRCPADDEEGR